MRCHNFFIVVVAALCFSCNMEFTKENYPILNVELKEQQVSLFDIFKSVEIIPLETSAESLFAEIDSVDFVGDTVYVFSRQIGALLMFDTNGRYIHKIQKIGRGPGEYTMVYDYVINHEDRSIGMLNPVGSILTYDSLGNFIMEDHLPIPPNNYQFFEILDDNNYIMWSLVEFEDGNGVNVVNKNTFMIEHGGFPFSDIWGGFAWGSVFHKFGGEVYYSESLANKVYRFTSEGYKAAYEWNTGVKIINSNELTDNYNMTNEGWDRLIEQYESGKIPFVYGLQLQSEGFYYALLISNEAFKNLFYEKESGKSLFFEKTTEGIDLNIIHMGESYAIGLIKTVADTERLQKVVSLEDAELLRNRRDDDNWWLVKYTFK